MKRILKISAITAAGLIIILTALLLLIGSGALNFQIAKTVSQIAGKSINGKVGIGKIEGNLLSEFTIIDISVNHGVDTIVKLDQFELKYNLSGLLQKNIFAEKAVINGLHLFISEDKNGKWNFQKLLPATDTTYQENISEPPDWQLHLPAIELNNITVNVDQDEPSQIPKYTQLNSALSFEYSNSRLFAKILKFNLLTEEPELRITHMKIETSIADSVLSWKDFELNLPVTRLVSKGSIPLNKVTDSEAELEISPLDFNDLNGWVKGICGKPEIKLKVNENGSKGKEGSRIYFSITENNQSVEMNGNIFETGKTPVYDLLVETKNINAADWTGNPELYSNITGSVQVRGEGFNIEENKVSLNAEFANVQYEQYKIDNINLSLNKSGDIFNAILNAATPWGKVFSDIQIQESKYNLDRINLDHPALKIDISGYGNLKGSHNVNLALRLNTTGPTATHPAIPENIHLTSSLDAVLTGTTDSMHLDAGVKIDTLAMDEVTAGLVSVGLISDFSLKIPAGADAGAPDSTLYSDLLKGLSLVAVLATKTVAYNKYRLDSTILRIEKTDDEAKGTVTVNSPAGDINAEFLFSEIFNTPAYHIKASLNDADISKATFNESHFTNINFDLTARGRGVTPGTSMLDINIKSAGSSLFGHKLEDFSSNLEIENYNYKIKGLIFDTPFMLAEIAGEGDIKKNNNLRFSLKAKDTGLLTPLTGIESPDLNGEIRGELTGSADSLNISAGADIQMLKAGELSVENIIASASINLKDSSLTGSARLRLDNTQIKDFTVKQFEAKSDFNENKAESSIRFFSSDSLNGYLKAGLTIEESPILTLQELIFKIQDNEWVKTESPSTITLLKDSLLFNNFEINSKNSFVKIDGALATEGKENFNVEARDIRLIPVPGLQIAPFPISGTVNGALNISGTAALPVVSFNASAGNLELNNIQFEEVRLDAAYNKEKLIVESYADRMDKRLFEADGEIPVKISLEGQKFQFIKKGEISATAIIDKLDMSMLNSFIPLTGASAAGTLSANAEIKNRADDPEVKGSVSIENGSFRYDRFGISYKDIGMKSRITNNIIALDSLKIFAGKGELDVKGYIKPDTLYNGSFNDINLSITGNNFRPLDSDLLRAEITTGITLTGNSEKPVLGGKLIIQEANLNTDLFLKEFDRVPDDLEEPLLIEAREQAEKVKFHQTAMADNEKQQMPGLMNNLSGEFDIEIPGNAWIKGKNMNFEINGLLKAVIQGSQIDLFGTMNVRRGYYKIYGKRLDFEEGEVTLTGGEEIDPQINFNIAYRFRDVENLLRKLNIKATGKVSKPELSFTLDDSPVQEKDAISYLLFNKSSGQLDSHESSSIQGGNLDIARDLALGQLSGVVKDALQSSLGPDVIEISGEDGWSQGSVSIGKYITNNLFLSYQRNFALDKKNKQIEPEKISLEYQLLKSLFLQATNQGSDSGFDFILKWTWK